MSESDERPPPEDAVSDGPPAGHDESATEAEDVEFNEALEGLQAIESSRRTKGAILGIGALVLVGLSVFAIYEFSTFLFRPDMSIEQGEQELLDKTDDPQCRELIARMSEIRETFFGLEADIEEVVADGTGERRRKIADKLDELVTRLDEAESLSHRANFRHENTESDVDRWFQYTRDQLIAIRDLVAPEAYGDVGVGGDDGAEEPTPGSTGGGDAGDGDAGSTDAGKGRSVVSRMGDMLFNTHRSFEKFRVWHSSERFAHPCGDADEMEEPWRPPEGKGDAGVGNLGGDTANGAPSNKPTIPKRSQ